MYKKYEEVVSAKLISYTQEPPLADEYTSCYTSLSMNPTGLIAYCARVSNPANQSNHDTAEKLIRYLVDHKHWSPLEMVDVTLELVSTRDIIRQLLRHKSFSFQEFSQRYADPTTSLEDSFVIRELRMQDKKNRQNSLDASDNDFERWWEACQRRNIDSAAFDYEFMIRQGAAKEVARALLPEGNTVSRVYAKNSMRGWLHYLEVRTGPETQKEHRLLAQKCALEIAKVFPTIKEFTNEKV